MARLNLPVIGRTVAVSLDKDNKQLCHIPARVDTGAYMSAVWASNILEKDGELQFSLFDRQSPFYTGIVYRTRSFRTVKVVSSFGDWQQRYAIELEIVLAEHQSGIVQTAFTLADRSKKKYPILIGRKFLRGRYRVDVQLSDKIRIKDEEITGQKQVDEEEERRVESCTLQS